MGKFAIKAAALTLILMVLIIILILSPWLRSEPFHNITKKHAILEKIRGPKIILVGGSGVANGLSARIIRDNFPGYAAVNMGLNAGLGLEFNLNEVKEYIQAGDLIIMSPEYENFEGGYNGGVQLLKAINIAPFVLKYVSSDRLYELLSTEGLTFVQLKAQCYFDGFTSLFSNASVEIDDTGDRTSKSASRDVSRIIFSFNIDKKAYGHCVSIINDFVKLCRVRGATAMLSFPSLPSPQYASAKKSIEELNVDLRKDTNIWILHSPGKVVFDPIYFDDTEYHLGRQGREIRSLMVATLIGSGMQRQRLRIAAWTK